MSRYVYLGKRVEDIGEKGLDTVEECKGIADAILEDYRNGDISYRTAMSRLNLLELIAKKNSKFTSWEEEECTSSSSLQRRTRSSHHGKKRSAEHMWMRSGRS